jgi:hypothetical protein
MKGKKTTNSERRRNMKESEVERRKIFRELLTHLRAGYSVDCFAILSDTMIKTCLDTYPKEFVREDFEDALRDGKSGWESIGRRQAEGTCLGNSRSWYYNMANRYRWSDRQQVETEHKGQVSVSVINYGASKGSRCSPEGIGA